MGRAVEGVDDKPNMVTVGRVVGLYGVQGWLRVYSYTQPKENLLAYPKWQLCGSKLLAEFAVEASKKQGKGLVAKLQRVDDRDQARAWLGFDIRIPRADLPELGEDEYYWADLLGLEVYDLEQRHLGVVDHLLETGANDVMVVCGDRERLIPFVPGYYVKRVDLNRGFISVDWDPEF